MGVSEKHIKPPFGDQRFDSFDQWVNRASSWLTCHAEYNNTEHGNTKGWRGNHFTALCFDSFGRRCRSGADMQRARDENAFPVWWIWPDQIIEALASAEREGMMRAAGIVTGLSWQIEISPDHVRARNPHEYGDAILSEANTHSVALPPPGATEAGEAVPQATPASPATKSSRSATSAGFDGNPSKPSPADGCAKMDGASSTDPDRPDAKSASIRAEAGQAVTLSHASRNGEG